MDFNDAITAHVRWRMQLACYLIKPDGSLNAALVASPEQCELGQWLRGEGHQKYSSVPEFTALVASHARLHKLAAEIVSRADSGQAVMQEIVQGSNSDFSAASNEVIRTLRILKAKLSSAA